MHPLHLSAAGSSLVLSFESGEAEIVHWGPALGPGLPDMGRLNNPIPHSALDAPIVAGLLPQASSGWAGRPGLRGYRWNDEGVPGFHFSPCFRVTSAETVPVPAGTVPGAVSQAGRIIQTDPKAGLELTTTLVLNPGGLLEVAHELLNNGTTDYAVEELALSLPVPARAGELLDFTGRWIRENHPQRQDIRQGTWVRTGRHGRTGHDSSLLVAAGTKGFGNRRGEVWATHFGWSGNHEQFLDSLADGRRMLGATELLGSGELVLAPGEGYRTPVLYAAYSAQGLDGVTDAFYRWFRARPNHVDTTEGRVRPVVLNTWEAVYFDHRLEPLMELATSGAGLGAERYVLDDGWFRGRRDDTAGLGDWFVDQDVWPRGLTPLIEHVNGLGMEFGLWVEPEMVNLDSDVAREHPEWIVGPDTRLHTDGGRLPLEWRGQHVLDLANPEAWQYVHDRLDALLTENNIAYLKWDQNRDLTEHGHGGRPSVHGQTLAAYRLLDALKVLHPNVEIESCSSGGARVDLGILQRTDRVWASDCNDALERQTIQRWTQAVLPPELVGAHVGPTRSHTTGRVHDITFRAITAIFGHFGMEWDVRQATARERTVLKRAIGLYKKHRGLLHSGTRVNADIADPNLSLHGVVARDQSEALYAAVVHASLAAEVPGRVELPGLDPRKAYRVQVLMPTVADLPTSGEGEEESPFVQIRSSNWLEDGVTVSGAFLANVGLPLPVLRPEHALLLHAGEMH
ncbi:MULTISPECIES: alpha-galactosidase [unclassified Arthrobacter]|uniref:alpha-galactosidase n=1 Tax=unclassified Arthrobacter TaxID=235627 RepID=UPI00159DFF8E|nr:MULTISPECIES: alpha-galactosidase [unclassified Arthrobacter]MCQ9165705.1 alpha-galactosidase [Arthrobacter sp. STN4]NVN00556.1 alpha-galactosidase [Arthrobacter sp. SDTb3-6]